MCQAPVGKVKSVNGNEVTIEYNGKSRVLRSKLPDLKEGDYVQFSLDIAIDRIDEEEAKAILGEME